LLRLDRRPPDRLTISTGAKRYISHLTRDAVWRAVDDLYLLYHRPSGETHVLAPDLFAILEAVDERALDAAAVLSKLAAEHEIEAEEAPLAIVSARLAELAALGLADERR
jgi:PqqD family protein of HPr-rel-A system